MKQELLEISRQLAELTERLNAIAERMAQEEQPVKAENVKSAEIPEIPEVPEILKTPEAPEVPEIPETPTIVETQESAKPIQFTLNDRYRFLREIFGNSTDDMAANVSRIEQMTNAREVTDFVVGTMNLDPEEQSVKDFLAAVNERFNERPTLLA